VLDAELWDERGRRTTSSIDQFSPLSLRLRYVVRKPLVGSSLCVWINYRGTRLFTSFDTDEQPERLRKRPRGLYQTVIPLPTELLKAGRYTIGLDSGIVNVGNSHEHQRFEGRLDFEVREAFATSLKGYAPHRPGLIALRSNWGTHRLDRATSGRLEEPISCGDTP
jgi:hypothetical protein